MKNRVTHLQRWSMVGLTLAFAAATLLGIATATWGLVIFAGLMFAVMLYGTWWTFQQPLRPRTHFERFEDALMWRTLLCLVGGGLLIWVASVLLPSIVLVGLIFGWLGISAYFASKLRSRYEAIAAYKRRVGYQDPTKSEPHVSTPDQAGQ